MAVSRDDPRLQNAGFARLVGNNVDYTVRKYSVVLGRPNKTVPVDVILTSAMSVSRQHARIYYNFETHQFELEVMGKNGVVVDGVQHEANGPPVPLKSKALLQVGSDVSFHFLLPKRKSKVLKMLRKGGGDIGAAHPSGAATPASGQKEAPLTAALNQMTNSSEQQTAMYAAAAAAHVQQQHAQQHAQQAQQQQLAMVAQALAWQQQQAAAAAAQVRQQVQAAATQQHQSPGFLHDLFEQIQQAQEQQQAQQAQQALVAAMALLSPQQQLQLLVQQQQQQLQQQQQQGTPPGSLPPPSR